MVASDPKRASEPRRTPPADERAALPYTVELTNGGAVRVLARAATASLARAIFSAACTEYPGAGLLLKRGAETIIDSHRSR